MVVLFNVFCNVCFFWEKKQQTLGGKRCEHLREFNKLMGEIDTIYKLKSIKSKESYPFSMQHGNSGWDVASSELSRCLQEHR